MVTTITPFGRRIEWVGRLPSMAMNDNHVHKHIPVTTYALRQRAGVPYEVQRTVCAQCRRVLGERQLRRAAA